MAALTDRLNEELAAVRGELSRLDGKCATLTGLAGAALAFVVTQTGHGPILTRLPMAAAGVALAAAVVILLASVLRPRFGPTGFPRYATMTATQICDLLGTQANADDTDRAQDLEVLSGFAWAKNRRLRVSVDLMVVAVALITLGMATSVSVTAACVVLGISTTAALIRIVRTQVGLISRMRAIPQRLAMWMAPENPQISRVVIAAVFALLAIALLAGTLTGHRS